jgi:hypothetical protein
MQDGGSSLGGDPGGRILAALRPIRTAVLPDSTVLSSVATDSQYDKKCPSNPGGKAGWSAVRLTMTFRNSRSPSMLVATVGQALTRTGWPPTAPVWDHDFWQLPPLAEWQECSPAGTRRKPPFISIQRSTHRATVPGPYLRWPNLPTVPSRAVRPSARVPLRNPNLVPSPTADRTRAKPVAPSVSVSVTTTAHGLARLADRSSRPLSCPHQVVPRLEAAIVVMRPGHPGWGPRTILY